MIPEVGLVEKGDGGLVYDWWTGGLYAPVGFLIHVFIST